MALKTVSASQFWSKGFTFCCFIPLAVLTALHVAVESYLNAAWQAVTLAILCVNNYLLCSNYTLRRELFEQLQINIALIEYLKKFIKDDEENNVRENEK